MPKLVVLVGVVVATLLLGALWRWRTGRVKAVRRPVAADLSGLDIALGERATLVQFSSAFCAPCRATRRILTDVAELVDGVRYAEVDAESHLAVVRRLGILRTPTTLVLDGRGRVVQRATGQPRKHEVLSAVAQAVDPR
jgi:thiol-disulfide isomerase/thioredoxin